MSRCSRSLCFSAVFCLLAALALAQSPAEDIIANQNRTPAGKLENGALTLHLELRNGAWRPEADDGPKIFVQAIGEAGKPAQIPGPLMRMPTGTTVHVSVTNKLKEKAKVYGLNTRPGDPKAAVELAPGESKEWSFAAGAPGTYFYWARTSEPVSPIPGITFVQPIFVDAQMNGAFIVDPAAPVPPDRVFVINTMLVKPDVVQEGFEVVSINGKSYPYTEPLEYTAGDTIRWRVINPSPIEHPMHLHGAFFQLLSFGDFEKDTAYAEGERQSMVTKDLAGAHTILMQWQPAHVGRWLFHCHFHFHMSAGERLPVLAMMPAPGYDPPATVHVVSEHHDSMGAMKDMGGLVMVINVKGPAPVEAAAPPPRKIDLVIEPTDASGNMPTFTCKVREGKKIVASEDKAVGPPIVVTRGQPTEITVTNHLNAPTSIHWHGLELDSYYDGVVGAGVGDQVAPAIPPGGSFIARFTPNRAGTFIYHTHSADPSQLSGGVYGALIVLEPGESFDAAHDKLLVIGSRDTFFDSTHLTVNGMEKPGPIMLTPGVKYRLRLINMAPNLTATFQLGSKEHPEQWLALAKDGATLPPRLATTSDAVLHITSGETYDFQIQPDKPGEIPLQLTNLVGGAKLEGKLIVQ
jgi:FtsP/CotA-like multicopper oxidase with cupredoxin domain